MPGTRLLQTYSTNGVKLTETSVVVSDAELRAEAAIQRLIAGRAQLRQIRNDAQAFSGGTGALTLAQLTSAARQLAGGMATLTQTLMDIELVLAQQQDDGVD